MENGFTVICFFGKHENGKERAFIVSENYNCYGGVIYLISCASWEVDLETVGQYTGLKDKNGNEIYEGDIVKIHRHSFDYGFKQEEIGRIKFIDGSFGFFREKCKNEYYFNTLSDEADYGELDYYEVIGNIYENKKLLEG